MFCKILSILPISIILSKPTDSETPAIIVPTSPIIETTIENIDNTNDLSKTNDSYNEPKTKTIHREGKLPGGRWSFTSKTTTNGNAMPFDTNQFFNNFFGKNNKPFINSQELLNSQKTLNEVMQDQINSHGIFGNQNNDGFFINSDKIKAFFGPQQTNFGNQFLKTNYDRDELQNSWSGNKWNGNIMRDSFPINDNSRSQDSYGRMGIQSPYANDDYETPNNYLNFDYTQLILALFVINAVLFIIAYSIKIKRVRQLNRQRSLLEANLRSGGCRDDTTINIREKEELPILPKYEDVVADQDQSVIIPLPKNPDMNNVDQNNSKRIAGNQPMDQNYDLPPCETNCKKEESTPPSYDEAK